MEIFFICLAVLCVISAAICGYLIGKRIFAYVQKRQISKSAIIDEASKKDNFFY